jgi:PilZ domain
VRAHPSDERRQGPRQDLARRVTMAFGDLVFPGTIRNAGGGGLFVESLLLVETGEKGTVALDGDEPLGCRVVWMRPFTHEEGPGLGLVFDTADAAEEARAVAWVADVLAHG